MATLEDLYGQLFGKSSIQDGDVISMAEHGRVGGLSTGQGFKYVGILNASGSLISEFGGSSSGGSGIPVAGASLATPVAIIDGSGNQISSFGGGTQYNNGDSAGVPIGNVMMWRQSGDNTVQSVADDNPMPVTVINSSVLPTGAATSAKQDTQITLQTQLESLIDTLQELVQRLSPLAGAMRNTAQLGVIGSVAVTSAPSTAVTGPITSAQSIAEKAVGGIMYPEQVANINSAAIQSNINNAVAA